MPKRVDREQRRRLIAEAVLRLTATRGLEGVNLRDVAAAAGVSMGMVQHYFASKDRMLLFACEYLVERANQRVGEQIAALPRPISNRAILHEILIELLPLDDERKAGIRVWFAFLALAVVQPELETFMRETWQRTHTVIAGLFAGAREHGELPPTIDPDAETVRAFALADGLVSHVLLGHYTGEQARDAIDDYLDELFTRSALTEKGIA